MSETTKNCPYCGEEVLIDAKKCRHCKEWLEDSPEETGLEFFNLFIGRCDKTRETVIEQLENTNKSILFSEFTLLNKEESDKYRARINWFSLLLYIPAVISYAIASILVHIINYTVMI